MLSVAVDLGVKSQAPFSLCSSHYCKKTLLRLLTKLRENNSQTFLAPVSRILNMHFDEELYFQVSLVLRKMTVKIQVWLLRKGEVFKRKQRLLFSESQGARDAEYRDMEVRDGPGDKPKGPPSTYDHFCTIWLCRLWHIWFLREHILNKFMVLPPPPQSNQALNFWLYHHNPS